MSDPRYPASRGPQQQLVNSAPLEIDHEKPEVRVNGVLVRGVTNLEVRYEAQGATKVVLEAYLFDDKGGIHCA